MGPMVRIFDFHGNYNHGFLYNTCGYYPAVEPKTGCGEGRPYGAWLDGTINPYKINGTTFFQIPHSEFYRIRVPSSDWMHANNWMLEPGAQNPPSGALVSPPQRDQLEAVYNNRNWLFSVYVSGSTLYGVTHHEAYRRYTTIHGVGGFEDVSAANNYGRSNVAGIGWVKSVDGGNTWVMKPKTDYSRRMILVPQPSDQGFKDVTYGFMHPSNIVKQGSYYYVFVNAANFDPDGGNKRRGVSLIRTSDLSQSINWQYWSGVSWITVNHNTFQGNNGSQVPYVFWSSSDSCTGLYATNVRKHVPSGKWVILGSQYCTDPSKMTAVFSWTVDLSNPIDLERRDASGKILPPKDVVHNGNYMKSNVFYSFFEITNVNLAGENYENISNNPIIMAPYGYPASDTNDGQYIQNGMYYQYLELTGF
jgi:hypothetical protein